MLAVFFPSGGRGATSASKQRRYGDNDFTKLLGLTDASTLADDLGGTLYAQNPGFLQFLDRGLQVRFALRSLFSSPRTRGESGLKCQNRVHRPPILLDLLCAWRF